jgi:pimeloyl-ACP methyl ester carboxylesterase
VPDVVLIHSTGQGASGWDLVVQELAARDVTTHAVELPDDDTLRADDFAQLTRDQVGALPSPVVLAHSGSGPLLPATARLLDASHQVWLAAWVPAADASFAADARAHLDEAFGPGWVGQDPITDDEAAEHFLYHDCDEDRLRWALSTRRPFYPAAAYDELLALVPEIPSTYIVATQDRAIRPEWQRRLARERLGVEPVEIDSGHCPNVSQPRRLAELLVSVS